MISAVSKSTSILNQMLMGAAGRQLVVFLLTSSPPLLPSPGLFLKPVSPVNEQNRGLQQGSSSQHFYF
jgi:hypothetical protein